MVKKKKCVALKWFVYLVHVPPEFLLHPFFPLSSSHDFPASRDQSKDLPENVKPTTESTRN